MKDCHAPYRPRFPSGAHSVIKATAPPNSPPAERPWTIRSAVSNQGAAAPAVAYVGSAPISVVAPVIVTTAAISTGRRPKRSPARPRRNAPSGRKKKASANVAYVLTRASAAPPPCGVKKLAATTVAK